MPLYQVVSVIGSILLLTAYAGMQTGHIKTTTYFYQIANLVGAACLTYSVIKPFNTGVFITEFVWSIFSLIGLYKTVTTVRKKRAETGLTQTADPENTATA
ncbi:CBU_0592 family membrane protein [Tessaracoccus sp.]